jgi:ADP-heptose:LPS heptosyltransferase
MARILISMPPRDRPGLRAEAVDLALGLTALGHEVVVLGTVGALRHPLRAGRVTAPDLPLPSDDRKLTPLLQDFDPQVLHLFGLEAAGRWLPQCRLIGAGGVVTLGHADLLRFHPAALKGAAAVLVPCAFLRDQLARRLPHTLLVVTGHLLPPRPALVTPPHAEALALGLDPESPLVMLADGFVGAETQVALTVIQAVQHLAERLPLLQALLVGDGPRRPEVEGLAQTVNEALGRRAVLVPGERDDVGQLLSLATVAVGSGRFAQEAIAAGVPLVAAGPAGLVGTYTAETTETAGLTCCGRHGRLDPLTPRALASEIFGLLTHPELRADFAAAGQTALLATAERSQRAAQVATYYERATPTATVVRTPQRLLAILPEELREFIFTLPALGGLRARFPLAQLALIAPPIHVHFLTHLGLADQVWTQPRRGRDWLRLLPQVAGWHADNCLAFARTLPAQLLACCSRAGTRVGYAEGGGSILLSDHLTVRGPLAPARALTLTTSVGVSTGALPAVPPLPPATREVVDLSLLAAGIEYADPLILLCPHMADGRDWPHSHWLTLMGLLLDERPERIAVLGSDHNALPAGITPIAPVQDTLVLAGLLTRAHLIIAPDCGILHLADLLGTPTLGLYGPSAPDTCGLAVPTRTPLCHAEYPCHPCDDAVCPERHCLRALTPHEVAEAVRRVRSAECGVRSGPP